MAWQKLTTDNYFGILGVIVASVTLLLERFSANEIRYKQLTKTDTSKINDINFNDNIQSRN